MKYLPFLALAFAVSAYAAPEPTQFVGTSDQPVSTVAQCVAQKWADKTQQTVIAQVTIANDQGFDVMTPGARPGGAAAVLHRKLIGPGTWAGIRGSGDREAAADIKSCL